MSIISTPPSILRNGEYLSILRVIELPLIVLAFSTELAYKAQLSYDNYCPLQGNYIPGELTWTFPYDLKNFTINNNLCIPVNYVTTLISVSIYGQAIAFLDFVISIVLGLAWLGGSIAWLVSVIQLDIATRYAKIHATILSLYPCTPNPEYCELKKSSAIEIIYASPIAGLIVAFLYFGHLYAVWQNTTWYLHRYNKTKVTPPDNETQNRSNVRRGDVRPTAPEYEITVKKETVKFQTNVPESEYRRHEPPPRPPPPYSYMPTNTVTVFKDDKVYVNRQYDEPPTAHVTRVRSVEWPEY